MEELKQEVNTIQNELDKLSVEARIKSKTNAAYRMLHILNKGKGKGEVETDWNRKVKDVKSSKREAYLRSAASLARQPEQRDEEKFPGQGRALLQPHRQHLRLILRCFNIGIKSVIKF